MPRAVAWDSDIDLASGLSSPAIAQRFSAGGTHLLDRVPQCGTKGFFRSVPGLNEIGCVVHFPALKRWVIIGDMASVVFLRAINVGTANRCRPAEIAKKLARFEVVNIGAVGTFVVRKDVSETTLRAAIARQLPFKTEIMICPARDLLKLAAKNPFAKEPSGPNFIRFVNVMHKPLRKPPALPLSLPSNADWTAKIIAIQGRFVLGIYRREMKAIGYMGKLERQLGVLATNRSWNTIEKVVQVLKL